MPTQVIKNGKVLGTSPTKEFLTPVRQLGKCSRIFEKDEGNKGLLAKTPNKADVIRCICGKNRESAAKDRRDWVQCPDCGNWSHPSCYKIAQVVVAADGVPFLCFFCVMTLLTRMQGVFRNQVVREQQDIKLGEEIETIQKDKEEVITTLKARIEEIEKLITDREADLIKLECQLKQSIAEKYPRGSATKLAGEFQRLEKNKSENS